jgi:hypothetical protein
MPFLRPSSSMLPALPSDYSFGYWRPTTGGVIEFGIVLGREVALPAHFHEDDQVTFVLAGRRRLVTNHGLTVLGPGEGVVIPAGIADHSLSESSVSIFTSRPAPAPGSTTSES